MLKNEKLPKGDISELGEHVRIGGQVEVMEIKTIKNQRIVVKPWTKINKHKHNETWDIWLNLSAKKAYVCLKGEEHELINNSEWLLNLMGIQGKEDYTFDDFCLILGSWGFEVQHGSMIIGDEIQ